MGYDPLIKAVYYTPKGSVMIIEWENGLKITGTLDTIFESNNRLEVDDPEYMEFDAAAIMVRDVISKPLPDDEGEIYGWLKQNISNLIEISFYVEPPLKISLLSGEVIWSR